MSDLNAMNYLASLEADRDVSVPGMGGGAPTHAAPQASQAPLSQEEMLRILHRTPMGHPGFVNQRMTPGGQPVGENPLTGRKYGSYQEFMATRAPEAFANSLTGRGQIPMSAPQGSGQQDMTSYAALVRQFLGK